MQDEHNMHVFVACNHVVPACQAHSARRAKMRRVGQGDSTSAFALRVRGLTAVDEGLIAWRQGHWQPIVYASCWNELRLPLVA